MTVLKEIIETAASSTIVASKTLRHLIWERDFEVYFCGLELTTFEGSTVDYFIFPVMPNNITKTHNERTTVYRTFGGVTVLNSDSFTPQNLTLTGNFGRSFKLLIDKIPYDIRGLRFSQKRGVNLAEEVGTKFVIKPGKYLPLITTGYGCIKILQAIIDKSKSNVDGKPFRLYFYNPALSENYLVVPTKQPLTLTQDVNASNMLWNYTLNLEIISPLENITPLGNTEFLMAATTQQLVSDTARRAVGFG